MTYTLEKKSRQQKLPVSDPISDLTTTKKYFKVALISMYTKLKKSMMIEVKRV